MLLSPLRTHAHTPQSRCCPRQQRESTGHSRLPGPADARSATEVLHNINTDNTVSEYLHNINTRVVLGVRERYHYMYWNDTCKYPIYDINLVRILQLLSKTLQLPIINSIFAGPCLNQLFLFICRAECHWEICELRYLQSCDNTHICAEGIEALISRRAQAV
jgi:hypothetical protein